MGLHFTPYLITKRTYIHHLFSRRNEFAILLSTKSEYFSLIVARQVQTPT